MTYTKMLEDGRHEYGRIEKAADRRKDRMVAAGTADTFEEADRLRASAHDAIPGVTDTEKEDDHG